LSPHAEYYIRFAARQGPCA